jgi:hypothetical protein
MDALLPLLEKKAQKSLKATGNSAPELSSNVGQQGIDWESNDIDL